MSEKNKNAVKMYARFQETAPGSVMPEGHLKKFVERQYKGLAGHRKEMGNPFDTCMWTGSIDVEYLEDEYNGVKKEVPSHGYWWPYEQAAYYLDGIYRLSFLTKAPDLKKLYLENLDYLVGHPDEKGLLAHRYPFRDISEWPLAVFFKSVIAYYESTKDKKVRDAFHKHYKNVPMSGLVGPHRGTTTIEGLLKVYEWTGDKELLKKALAVYQSNDELQNHMCELFESLNFSKLTSDERITMHGVSVSEEIKLPVLLYIYTGEKKWLDGAKHGLDKLYEQHEQPVGQISANEFTSGRDPVQGYETCVTSDMMWSLGYFVMADGTVEYADRMEKLVYNALPGSITKDFTALQYLSTVNQFTATPFANGVHKFYGLSAWRQYRPHHFPQCCAGNLQRILPNYVMRSWMKNAADGAPVAVLYGPTSYTFEFNGAKGTITEDTEYPFRDTIDFRFKLDKKVKMPFRFRIPAWTKKASVKLNGKMVKGTWKAGTFAEVEREWQDGDVLTLTLPAEVTLKRDRQWCWLERGPIVFSCSIPHRKVCETNSRFSPRSYLAEGDWNFALTMTEAEAKKLVVEYRKSSFPFETPSMVLRVPVERVRGYNELNNNRFTPNVPLFTTLTGEKLELELVPYGTTYLRITAFPDGVKRTEMPVVAAYPNGPYPYNYSLPIEAQKFPAETMSPDEYRKVHSMQRNTDQMFDLERFYHVRAGHLAYLMFRVWSDKATMGTFCLGCATTAQVFMDGKEVFRLNDINCAEILEPQWFQHRVKKGYNYVLVKVACGPKASQYRAEWGAKLTAFYTE